MEYIHRRWADWSFAGIAVGYLLFVPAMFWYPAWVVALAALIGGFACFPLGMINDLFYYRNLRREQER